MRDDDLIALVQGGVFAECKTVRAVLLWDRCSLYSPKTSGCYSS